MCGKITKLFLLLLLISSFLTAKSLGPDVSKYRGEELKWEDGAYGYHVMFKTLLENLVADADNPQADTCVNESTGSTYSLDISDIPGDAYVERAFLIWSGAVPVADINNPTDNEVTFSYTSAESPISETQVIKGKKAYTITESADFEFDAFRDLDKPNNSYFTYRVDVTDFFKNIHAKGRELGLDYDGYSLFGDYTLSDLTCASDSSYVDSTEMVSGWSLVMIYTSAEISPKNIYFYDGFKAYWHEESEINVTGFEFPTDPEVRLTLISHEGDPNLASLENPNGGPAIPEGLQVQGDQVGWLLISNECNPEAQKTDGINTLFYTEIYNSISSAYGWADANPTCIGGTPPVWDYENIEYAMDVDTFVMDSSKDDSYASHFYKGGERIGLRIGANKDQVITNMMVVSVDTKAPMFDIPGKPEKVACTPANTDGKWCAKGEHTFAIRVQNWGDDITPAVFVKDTIPLGMEYVPGSTEYATEFDTVENEKIAKKWTRIPDLGDGGFPLASSFKVSNTIDFCDAESDYLTCTNLIIVRFRATVPTTTNKNAVLENVAQIDTTGFPTYRTNLGLPVKLMNTTAGCVADAEQIDLSQCGGKGVPSCETDADCARYEICEATDKVCIPDPKIVECKDSVVTASIGKNSPVSDIIFIAPQEGLIMGQLALSEESGGDCYFSMTQLILKVKVNENNIRLSNFKLVYDANKNGSYDPEAKVEEGRYPDSIIASTDSIKDGYATFTISGASGMFFANEINNLLLIVDAGYKEDEVISRSATFLPSIENQGILIRDKGTAKLNGLPLEFSTFQFGPPNSFIVTKGPKDPAVPEKKDMNGTKDVLQLRVESNTTENKLTSLKVKLSKDMAKFGDGLSNISIWEDTDNDGIGDTKIAETSSTDSAQLHDFKNLTFAVPADQPKYLTVRTKINLKDGEYFQLQVVTVGIENDEYDVLGLPVNSKEYRYVCDPLYEDCGGDDGCALTAVPSDGDNGMSWLVFSVLIAAAAFFFEKKHKRSN